MDKRDMLISELHDMLIEHMSEDAAKRIIAKAEELADDAYDCGFDEGHETAIMC